MKSSIINSLIFIILIITVGFTIYNGKTKIDEYILLDKKIDTITHLNRDLDLFIQSSSSYNNFDIVQNKLFIFEKEFKGIVKDFKINNINDVKLLSHLTVLEKNIKNKLNLIQEVKTNNAVLTNSLRFIQKLKRDINSNKFNDLYITILTINHNTDLNTQHQINKINKISFSNNLEKLFLLHAKNIFIYQKEFDEIKLLSKELAVDKHLHKLISSYEKYAQQNILKAQIAVAILFIVLAILIILYLIKSYSIISKNIQLNRFRKTVENSDNIVLITDENQKIKYVNDAFTKTTGFIPKEVIGKKPNFLKSGKQSKEFYDKLNKTIYSGKKWSGEFINIDKNGELSYEKATITPVIDNKGNIVEFIGIKLDITKEILAQNELKEKENQLVQQSKMAAMGEMLENIAHQWRQPLSIISTGATGLQTQIEFGVSSAEEEIKVLKNINDAAQHLSATIDDFRDFFKPDRKKAIFDLKDIYKKTYTLISSKFKDKDIEIVENISNIELLVFDRELIQVVMNLLNNARDILETKENQRKIIFVDIFSDNKNAFIKIKDNGGGIPKDIIDKVFEPYFTTKHKAQGTGIGLYMSKEIVEKHMNGTIKVQNAEYNHEGKNYIGAEFIISLPIE